MSLTEVAILCLASFSVVAATVVVLIFLKLAALRVSHSPLDVVPGPPCKSLLTGNLSDLFHCHAWAFHASLTEYYGPVVRYHDLLGRKGLYVSDPTALHAIIVKEQDTYEEAEWMLSSTRMMFGTSLMSTRGEHHRKQRKLLNPVFHIKHMRELAPLFYRIVRHRQDSILAGLTPGTTAVDIDLYKFMNHTALELIGQGGLGYSFDEHRSDSTLNAYETALRDFVPTLLKLHVWRLMLPTVVRYIPPAICRVVAPYLPIPGYAKLREITYVMDKACRDIYRGKWQALERGDEAVRHQIGEGRDAISILMKANMESLEEDRLPEEELLAQMSVIVFAASDTTSSALSRIFHILAEHQDAQTRLRNEILEAGEDNEDIPYDALMPLPWLDAVCRETLRLYPPVSVIFRETRKDAVMPLSQPLQTTDGRVLSSIPVPEGTPILVGIQACNRSEAIWGPDALKWKPERWLSTLPDTVGNAHVPGVYSHLMTFIGGGRACLGFKFAELEIKVVLATVLRNFKLSLSDSEIYWNMAGINYPTLDKTGDKHCMTLKVERVAA